MLVAQGRRIVYRGVHGCFHDVAESVMAELPKPDAIFALNSGLIFYPTWADTVDKVLAAGAAPFVVTAWAQPEAVGVRQMLLDAHGQALADRKKAPVVPSFCRLIGISLRAAAGGLDLHSNPFASLVPQAVMDDHGTCNFNNRPRQPLIASGCLWLPGSSYRGCLTLPRAMQGT